MRKYDAPKLRGQSHNSALWASFTIMGFVGELDAPVIVDRGILYYLAGNSPGAEQPKADPWIRRDLADFIGRRDGPARTRFDIDGGVIEVIDRDQHNLRVGRIEYSAEKKDFVYSDLAQWNTLGSTSPVTGSGGEFAAALVGASSSNPENSPNAAVSSRLGDCVELRGTEQSPLVQKFPVSIALWKEAPRSVEHPEDAQVAPWCDSLNSEIRGGVGFSKGGDFVAALFEKRLRVYLTAGFGPDADPVIDAKLTRITLERAQANGLGFTFAPLALHPTTDASFQVAWANNGVQVLTAKPKVPELDGSTARSLAVPLADPAVKLTFDDKGNFLFLQDFDVSTRRLSAFVWDLRKDWTVYVDKRVTAASSLSQLKDFVCEIASLGFDSLKAKTGSEEFPVGNDHVSYTNEEKNKLGWDDSTAPPLADPCVRNSQNSHDEPSVPPG